MMEEEEEKETKEEEVKYLFIVIGHWIVEFLHPGWRKIQSETLLCPKRKSAGI